MKVMTTEFSKQMLARTDCSFAIVETTEMIGLIKRFAMDYSVAS